MIDTAKTLALLLTLALALAALTMVAGGADARAQASASDLGKEQRWRDQIVDGLMDGAAVDLQAGEVTFLGLFTEAEQETGRAAVIVHGIGVHPDWPQVVYPLRTALPGAGWGTLSIQMPVLANEATDADYGPLMTEVGPRLDAAVAYLKAQGAGRVAVIAHSLGATMVNDYLAGQPGAVDGYVAIGMPSGGTHAGRDNVELVGKITIPMLDLYGQNDLEAVVSGATARAQAGAVNPGYHQAQIPGADHFFDGYEEPLVETVVQWLQQNVPAP